MARLLLAACVVIAGCLLPAYVNAASCYKFLSKDDYPNCMQLDSSLVLHWRTIDNKTLELAPDADGYLGWLAIGISEAGLKGVDINVVVLGSQGLSWIMGDYFMINATTPNLDEEQNAVLVVSPTIDRDNHTLAIWQRPLDSCDTEDTPVFQDVERSISWAYSYDNEWEVDKASFTNLTRGLITGVRLFPSSNSSSSSSADALSTSITLAMPSFPVPAANTSVVCVNLQLPNDTAYHVTAYQGFNTTPFVHHVIGYVCAAGVVPAAPALGVPYKCANSSWPNPLQAALPVGCETVNYVWAPGAKGFTAPPEAGFAMGAGSAGALVLQVFYQNPTGVVGKSDSSGLTLTYTPTLRASTLGVLTLGNTDLRIPAAAARYTALPNICPASCTGKRVLQPVSLVSNFYMMGRRGVSTLTRHIRNGSAIQPVGRINYWDVEHPGFLTVFPDSRTLLPNDTLISLCTYDNSNSDSMTFYGNYPWQELCFNYLTFFPASAMPDLDYCVADTRKNVTTCATRTLLAAMRDVPDPTQLLNGTKVSVGPLNISYYESAECVLHDQLDVTPYHKPNTRAAVASIVLVPTVLLVVGWMLYSKYSKQEELELLLARAEQEGIEAPMVG